MVMTQAQRDYLGELITHKMNDLRKRKEDTLKKIHAKYSLCKEEKDLKEKEQLIRSQSSLYDEALGKLNKLLHQINI